MAFSYTQNVTDVSGVKYATGTYNAASVTTGTIVTGLDSIIYASFSPTSASPGGYISSTASGNITLTGLTSSQTGFWEARGN